MNDLEVQVKKHKLLFTKNINIVPSVKQEALYAIVDRTTGKYTIKGTLNCISIIPAVWSQSNFHKYLGQFSRLKKALITNQPLTSGVFTNLALSEMYVQRTSNEGVYYIPLIDYLKALWL